MQFPFSTHLEQRFLVVETSFFNQSLRQFFSINLKEQISKWIALVSHWVIQSLSEISWLFSKVICFTCPGRVCVPISMEEVDTFDPFTVPTIRYVLNVLFTPPFLCHFQWYLTKVWYLYCPVILLNSNAEHSPLTWITYWLWFGDWELL